MLKLWCMELFFVQETLVHGTLCKKFLCMCHYFVLDTFIKYVTLCQEVLNLQV